MSPDTRAVRPGIHWPVGLLPLCLLLAVAAASVAGPFLRGTLQSRPAPGPFLAQAASGPKVEVARAATEAVEAPKPTFEELDEANPVRPLPPKMLGHDLSLAELENPPGPQRVRLGRWLFFDKRLSRDGTIACASCHRSEFGFSLPAPNATGIDGQTGKRKAPTFINAAFAYFKELFWDGRAPSLEKQVEGPITNPIEMDNTLEQVVETLSAIEGYGPFFELAFGDRSVTMERVAQAIADYERTRISGDSPWDRWKAGDEDAVDSRVKRGDALFFGDAQCFFCHSGFTLTDNLFHNTGIGWDPEKEDFADKGRIVVSDNDYELGAFKTPTLRDVALRAPYMHDGSLATLKEAVHHYTIGGNPNPQLSKKYKVLGLSEEDEEALVAFLRALTGKGYRDREPTLFPR